MQFQEFWRKRDRMCEQYGCCQPPCFGEGCPMKKLFPNNKFSCLEVIKMYSIETEQIVKQWAKEHPIVTNGMKFMEIFGETFCSNMLIGSANEWWHAEYQPPKGEEG